MDSAPALNAPPTRTWTLVTGASSQLGVFLLPRLRAAGIGAVAVSRAAPAEAGEIANGLLWVRPERALSEGSGPSGDVSSLISCGPLALASELVARHDSIRRVVAFSTSSVSSKQDSTDRSERRTVREIRESESRLRRLCARRGLPLLLLRPTLIYGCGLDRNVSTLRRFGNRWGFIPLAGRAHGLRQPVHADDLASLALQAIVSGEPLDACSEACGGSTLRYRDMALKTAASCERKVRLLTLPPWVMAAALKCAAVRPGNRPLSPEMARRQNRNLVFDDSLLREKLGYEPRPFQPSAADFEIPEAARALQLPE